MFVTLARRGFAPVPKRSHQRIVKRSYSQKFKNHHPRSKLHWKKSKRSSPRIYECRCTALFLFLLSHPTCSCAACCIYILKFITPPYLVIAITFCNCSVLSSTSETIFCLYLPISHALPLFSTSSTIRTCTKRLLSNKPCFRAIHLGNVSH